MKEDIRKLLKKAVLAAKEAHSWGDFEMFEITVDYPKNEQFGDYTSNIAMVLAKKVGKNPMKIAKILSLVISHQSSENGVFEKIEVVQPGYLNFYLSKKYLQEMVEKINREKKDFGTSQIGEGIKINNEFISANPTGPLHLGNGRGGFYGDALSRVLRKAGFDVTNEYYVNDAGGQVEKLGHSVLKDAEAVYAGEYINELNEKYAELGDVRKVGQLAAKEVLENIIKKTTKEKMQIVFDEWMSEQKLSDEGYDQRAIEMLKEKKLTYESEGALWLRTTDFGDDKDRVLIKKDGKNAYMAGDCGYMLNKIERGYSRLVMGLGADHHGYVTRIKAVALALGFVGDFRIIISQMVRLVKDGKEARMSKRAGNVINLDDFIDEIGHDVTRFFFLMYSPDTHMNFDLGLAKERSAKNPVYYVQYAHARIASILAKAQESGISNFPWPGRQFPISKQNENMSLLTHEKELSLMKELNKFPQLVEEISENYEVHKLPQYAMKLADKFHSFYDACRVIDEENAELTSARLSLINAVRIVLAETLDLIGVDAPEKM
ncbi:MAG: Arginine-tRNA ligase [Parcubacteria group bacterium GW2011_GWD2_38_11]|nr:MAG: Arginine-tRNA ligase [Parcubacteria group bacterium GW2011_GWD2_38_11]